MIEGLKLSIPQRLFFLRVIFTLGLAVSFLFSLNLWGGQRFFPATPVFEKLLIEPPYDYAGAVLSMIFLVCSLVFYRTRTFITMALLVNVFMVLFDLNRLQPWFCIYNAALILFLSYNGRVDNPNRYTSVFILLQLVISSVYIFNGISQLMNPQFVSTDLYETILPLRNITSERQFLFFLKMGQFVPYLMIFIGVGLLIRSIKYLAISAAIVFHVVLLVFLFPSSQSTNTALWFMNLVIGLALIFLFSGETQQRYFSMSVLFQKPLTYLVVGLFWLLPVLNNFNYLPGTIPFIFKNGSDGNEHLTISPAVYQNLPLYVKSFCVKSESGYKLALEKWCNRELRSEYFDKTVFVGNEQSEREQLTKTYEQNPVPESELSSK